MKVLLVSAAFPPYNTSGSLRVGKLAAFLAARGHEVRVLTADGLPYPADLKVPISGLVVRTPFLNVCAPIDWSRTVLTSIRSGNDVAKSNNLSTAYGAVRLYRALFAMPDAFVGWIPYALRAADHILADWIPDVIVSSALPFSGHQVARRVARRIGRPWVAEFRDLFADNPYNEVPSWRRSWDRWLEKRVIADAAGCVTVSPALANALVQVHGKPTVVVLNGYDADDCAVAAAGSRRQGNALRIVYTGIIYPGRRDPTPLFEAIRRLDHRGKAIEIAFYGQDLRGVREAAVQAGVASQVTTHPPVSHQEALRLQAEADALLLLLWNDERERGVYTGKLFEYIGAARPILAIGCADGAAADLIRARALGSVATSSAEIAVVLDRWISEIAATGAVSAPRPDGAVGLTRTEQYATFEAFLNQVVETGAPVR